jgi:hypothetical protein
MLRQPATTGMPEVDGARGDGLGDAVGEDELDALVESQRQRRGGAAFRDLARSA